MQMDSLNSLVPVILQEDRYIRLFLDLRGCWGLNQDGSSNWQHLSLPMVLVTMGSAVLIIHRNGRHRMKLVVLLLNEGKILSG